MTLKYIWDFIKNSRLTIWMNPARYPKLILDLGLIFLELIYICGTKLFRVAIRFFSRIPGIRLIICLCKKMIAKILEIRIKPYSVSELTMIPMEYFLALAPILVGGVYNILMKIGKKFSNTKEVSPQIEDTPPGLRNPSVSCYMNAVVQMLASSSVFRQKLNKAARNFPDSIKINVLHRLLNNLNNTSSDIDEDTALVEQLIKEVGWTKVSQQDAFDLFSCVVNAILKDCKPPSGSKPEMMFHLTMKYTQTNLGEEVSSKRQYNLGLSLALVGNYEQRPGVELTELVKDYFMPAEIDDDQDQKSMISLAGDMEDPVPELLLLHIQANRWNPKTRQMEKPRYFLRYSALQTFPLTFATGSGFVLHKQLYKVVAVVKHDGRVGGGHYVTVREFRGHWFVVNDYMVTALRDETALEEIVPYILLCERCQSNQDLLMGQNWTDTRRHSHEVEMSHQLSGEDKAQISEKESQYESANDQSLNSAMDVSTCSDDYVSAFSEDPVSTRGVNSNTIGKCADDEKKTGSESIDTHEEGSVTPTRNNSSTKSSIEVHLDEDVIVDPNRGPQTDGCVNSSESNGKVPEEQMEKHEEMSKSTDEDIPDKTLI